MTGAQLAKAEELAAVLVRLDMSFKIAQSDLDEAKRTVKEMRDSFKAEQ